MPEKVNDTEDQRPEEEEQDRSKRSLWLRLLALVTVISFAAGALGIWPTLLRLPSLDFLTRAALLARNPLYQELRQAVVMVRTPQGQGTGFNLDSHGLIVTNFHVVKDAESINVLSSTGEEFVGKLTASQPELDLALIRIRAENLPHVDLADEPLAKDDQVVIIGNPLGFPQIIIKGRVLGERGIMGRQQPVLLIEGPISPGNSGSPVFDRKGRVGAVIFGTLTSKVANKDSPIGLAIPVRYLKQIRWITCRDKKD
ncbi:MAG TPA: serine protease [Bacillota bacterium]|nr:serine protease [Bacillota bacterium]